MTPSDRAPTGLVAGCAVSDIPAAELAWSSGAAGLLDAHDLPSQIPGKTVVSGEAVSG